VGRYSGYFAIVNISCAATSPLRGAEAEESAMILPYDSCRVPLPLRTCLPTIDETNYRLFPSPRPLRVEVRR
jgi:hypothetical protein